MHAFSARVDSQAVRKEFISKYLNCEYCSDDVRKVLEEVQLERYYFPA